MDQAEIYAGQALAARQWAQEARQAGNTASAEHHEASARRLEALAEQERSW